MNNFREIELSGSPRERGFMHGKLLRHEIAEALKFPWYARIVRAAVMRVRKELYIDAARAMGVSHTRVMLRHITPNSLTPTIVQGSMDFGATILIAASLSFIGLGARPPTIEWGLMAATARTQFLEHWWTAMCPGFAIFITVLAVNLVGDGLRDVLDPKHGSSQ